MFADKTVSGHIWAL